MISARKAYAIGQILKKANDLEIKGEIQTAIDEVKKAVNINPEDGNLYNRMGDLYLKLDKKEESIENFRKGVEAFRRDNFPRNALALSKKILRHEPNGFDMYYTIADLLVELDEKPDAAQYMFEYIEKQTKQNKEEEALNAIDYLKSLEIRDEKIQDRILDYYNMINKVEGESKPKKHAAPKKDEPEEKVVAATMEKKPTVTRSVVDKRKDERIDKLLTEFGDTSALRKDVGQLDEAVKEVEGAIVELRKAIRLDEVVNALDKSLSALSGEQKKAIEMLQESVADNLDILQKSIKELYQDTGKSMDELQNMLDKLSKALASLSKNQASIAQELNSNLSKLSKGFNVTTENSLKVVKSILANYKQATDEMCLRLEETKDANDKLVSANDTLVNVTGDMKQEINTMGESLSQFIAAQDIREKKRDRYVMIILVIISAICGLFVISLIIK